MSENGGLSLVETKSPEKALSNANSSPGERWREDFSE